MKVDRRPTQLKRAYMWLRGYRWLMVGFAFEEGVGFSRPVGIWMPR